MPLKIIDAKITRETIKRNPNTVYVFGDNDLRQGMGGLAKECRGESNTIGLRTKRKPTMEENAFYTDNIMCLAKVMEDVGKIENCLENGNLVVVTRNMGKGRAKLDKRAPKVYGMMWQALNHLAEKYNEN